MYKHEFFHPFTAIIAGPTGSGKTVFIKKLLKNITQMIKPSPERIMYCYSMWQEGFVDIMKINPSIEFVKVENDDTIIDVDKFDASKPSLLILDDLMQECKNNEELCNIFTKASHHKNISIMFLIQNLFIQGKQTRTMSLNSHYIIAFKNPRDRGQIAALARQMYPKHSQYLEECYDDATKEAHGYLLLDFKQQTPEHLRIRTCIFPNESIIVYVRNDLLSNLK